MFDNVIRFTDFGFKFYLIKNFKWCYWYIEGLIIFFFSQDQEEPFLVADLADIVYKYKIWKLRMPRIQPFYGNYNTVLYMHTIEAK